MGYLQLITQLQKTRNKFLLKTNGQESTEGEEKTREGQESMGGEKKEEGFDDDYSQYVGPLGVEEYQRCVSEVITTATNTEIIV